MLSTLANEPTEPMENADPTDPIDAKELIEPIDRNEFRDARLHKDPLGM